MSGDYTRFTFDPARDYGGVLKQQGRVALDADWNEWVEIINRRWRAETIDILGRCIVPKETPNGFRIQVSGGTFTVDPGRIYVDGLLAENHGGAPLTEVDPVLDEMRSSQPLPYKEQPYLPDAPPLPQGGPHIVYLDVWQREVTSIENPDLLEKALGGPDTTTRLQTVWQVKVLALEGIQTLGCDDEPEAWKTLVALSAGRLTTSAVGAPASDDPCILSPTGGYRGLENRLYRIQIHEPGPLGVAKFKWSRDNGSVVSAVKEIVTSGTQSQLRVSRIGRDQVLRFQVGDCVEVLDDHLELGSKAGHMAKVTNVDEANRVLTIEPAIPATFNLDATDPERHARVQRWDQKQDIGPDCLLEVTAGPIEIEAGIQVAFNIDPDRPDGEFKVGDYWVFEARTADGSVKELREALPHGIHHHYCRLAVASFPTDDVILPNNVTDCRVLWPPDVPEAGCDCTVCVTAESHNNGTLTIQRAIDQVKASGGRVCLGAGTYNLGATPVKITGATSVHLRGQGQQTILAFAGSFEEASVAAISIEDSLDVTVEELSIITPSTVVMGDRMVGGGPGIALRRCGNIILQRCLLTQAGSPEARAHGGPAIILGGVLFETVIRENMLVAAIGIGNFPEVEEATLLTAGLYIEDNLFQSDRKGISLEGFSLHFGGMRLSGNFLNECSQGAIIASGKVSPGSPLNIQGNTVLAAGDGIVVGTAARIGGNDISPVEPGRGEAGIVLALGLDRTGIDGCQVIGNRIIGIASHGIAIRAPLRSVLIKQNMIEGVGGGGIVMESPASADGLSIENNQLVDIAPQANEAGPVTGIRLLNAHHAEVASNVIKGVGQGATQSPSRTGIQVIASSSVRIASNDVIGVGPIDEFIKESAGIDVLGSSRRVEVVDNAVRRSRERPQGPSSSLWYALRVRRSGPALVEVDANLMFLTLEESVFVFSENSLISLPHGREILAVLGNHLEARGSAPVVEIDIDGICTFSNNRCLLESESNIAAATQINAEKVIISSNYVEGPGNIVAIRLTLPSGTQKPFTVLGNITNGVILVDGVKLPEPWAALNFPPP